MELSVYELFVFRCMLLSVSNVTEEWCYLISKFLYLGSLTANYYGFV
jgi:hypothetical protein